MTDSVVYAYGRYFGPAVLLKTLDQGKTWKTQSMSAYASGLVDGKFFNKDTGFVSGSSPFKHATILSTFDGGRTWTVRYVSTRPDSDGVWKLSFPSRNIAYASVEYWGSNYSHHKSWYLKSTDGGLNWEEHPFVANYNLQGIGFINDTLGWIGGWYETNFRTSDEGKNWTWETHFGEETPPYAYGEQYNINRFRRFGDTLMYASGNTVYKLQFHKQTGINELSNPIEETGNYPNPFSTQTLLTYNLGSIGKISVELFTVLGKKIYSEDLGMQNLGKHEHLLDVDLPAGIYCCCLRSEKFQITKKITIEK